MSSDSFTHNRQKDSIKPPRNGPPLSGVIRSGGAVEHSALADALRTVKPSVWQRYGITDTVISVLEVFVIFVRRMMDDSDTRHWAERFNDLEELLPDLDEAKVARFIKAAESFDVADVMKMHKRLTNKQGRLFFRKLIGAAAYDRVEKALRSDGALLVIAMRRVSRAMMPTALALDDAASVLSVDQLRMIGGVSELEHSMLNIVFQLDNAFDKMLGFNLDLDDVPVRPDEYHALKVDLATLAEQIRPLVTDGSEGKIAEVSDILMRKLRGAQDALTHSADGVSQAANSLVEFIDRLLRGAFPEQFVVDWLGKYYPDPKMNLTYVDQFGKLKPTKRGQALCFAHGGLEVADQSAFHQVAAAGIAETRSQLQQMKHADAGTPEEIAAINELFFPVRGFFLFAIRTGWAAVPSEQLDKLKARLAA